MHLRTFTILASLVVLIPADVGSLASDTASDKPSSENQLADQLDQYATDIRSIDRRFFESSSRLDESYIEERKTLRKTMMRRLKKLKKTHTENGELDTAVAIRDQMEAMEANKIVPPDQPLTNERGSRPTQTADILGTWRWNNGVDIKNLVNGQTNGDGIWRLIDPQRRLYEFRWKRIPPDRVTLSPNGRVLEGTKASDPSFRVWAVRID